MNTLRIINSVNIRVSALVLSGLIIYRNILGLLFNEAINNDLSTHLLIIPFLIVYLLFKERNYILAVISEESTLAHRNLEYLAGFSLFAISLLMKIYGSLTFFALEYNALSMPIFVASVILILFDYKTLRAVIFPTLMLVFLIPPPVTIAQWVGSTLARYAAYASFNFIKLIGLPAILDMSYDSPVIYLTTRSGQYIPFAIDIGCSGIYSLVGYFVFAVFISYIISGSLKHKLYTFALGFPLLYMLNVFRIIILLIVGYITKAETALNVFHLLGGWVLIFFGSLFLFKISEKLFNVNILESEYNICDHTNHLNNICNDCGQILNIQKPEIKPVDFVKILSLLLIAILFTSIKAPIFTLTSSTSEILIEESSELEVQLSMLPSIPEYESIYVYRDTYFEELSGQDASIMYYYRPQQIEDPVIWVGFEIAETKGVCHPWEVCLVTARGDYAATQIDLRDILLSENPPTTARYFAFSEDDPNNIQIVLYWYTKSLFKTVSGYEEKWAKISLITYAFDENQVSELENQLEPFAVAIFNHWKPVTSWAAPVLRVAQSSYLLMIVLGFILIASLGVSLYQTFNEVNSAQKIYSKLTDETDKEIIEALLSLKKPSCDLEILNRYEENAGAPLTLLEISIKLEKAGKLGIIKSIIQKSNSQPRRVWKLNTKQDIPFKNIL